MIVLAVGCSYRNTPVEFRERLALEGPKLEAALDEMETRFGCEAVILSTCNRVEIYLARTESKIAPRVDLLAEFLGEFHELPAEDIVPHLYEYVNRDAIRHLFRVTSSLDSMVIGEGQIAGQVKRSYELAQQHDAAGSFLHALFQYALAVSKRVRTETGITRGHVSVSSAAVDYVRQVFDHFSDKIILVIGAGKMGELTLKHLESLQPRQILVTNRSPEKAIEVAKGCGGTAVPWEQLDQSLAQADIVLSTTGSPEPIMLKDRYRQILAKRSGSTQVILDIAVPRDFDPAIHDGHRVCLFNIDDLKRLREQTLADRMKHITPAEAIIEQETRKFEKDWSRRRSGPIIAQLTRDFECKRKAIVEDLFKHLNGKLSETDQEYIEGAFRLLQNRFLHGPISALADETAEAKHHSLYDAMLKLFRLQD